MVTCSLTHSWNRTRRRLAAVLALASVALVAAAAPVQTVSAAGANLYVATTGTNTANNCRLRTNPCATIAYALSQSNAGDTINLHAGTFFESITVSVSVTIVGAGANKTIVDGNNAGRVFDIASGTTVTLTSLSIEHGRVCGDNGAGVANFGTLTLTYAAISGNTIVPSVCGVGGNIGGGIINWGTASLVADTISGNSGDEVGGGYVNHGSSTLTNVTVAGNSAFDAAGIFNFSGTIAVTDSTIASNHTTGGGGGGIWSQVSPSTSVSFGATIVANNTPQDCIIYFGAPNDAGYNLDSDGTCGFSAANHSQSGVNPQLGPLNNNGGPTQTMSPQLGSPALNQIPTGTTLYSVSVCPGVDQRGVARPQTALWPNCDVGAVELTMPVLKVVFTGTTAAPTITIYGSNLGSAPVGLSDNNTPCGSYTNNGSDFGENLFFTDVGNFTAGEGTPPSGSCVGIIITSWSPNFKVVLNFGSAYNSFDHWFITAGDSYTLTIKGLTVSGTVVFS